MGSVGPEPGPAAGVRFHSGLPDFQAIYGEFQPKIHRYLTRLVGVTDAEDLTQEVFVKVSQALPGFWGGVQRLDLDLSNCDQCRFRSAAEPHVSTR